MYVTVSVAGTGMLAPINHVMGPKQTGQYDTRRTIYFIFDKRTWADEPGKRTIVIDRHVYMVKGDLAQAVESAIRNINDAEDMRDSGI